MAGKAILFQRVVFVLGERGRHGTGRCAIGLGLSVLGLHVLGAMTNFRVHGFLEFHAHEFRAPWFLAFELRVLGFPQHPGRRFVLLA